MNRLIFTLLLLIGSVSAYALTIGEQADSAYMAEDYSGAIELYTRSIELNGHSSDIHYNLGNAYYRNGKLGKAVVEYERALRLSPANADARTNLEFVKSRIQDRPEDDTAFFAGLHRKAVSGMSANAWAWIAFVIFLLFMGAVALYIFANSVALRKTGFFGGITLLVIFAYTLLAAHDSYTNARSHETAVVTVPSTQLSSTPRASKSGNDKVVTIHEGTAVEIVDSVATPDDPVSPKWYNVKINNSTKAWLRASDIERI
ncbi:MAG: tetratricopeptide repeat protein [Muribaculaceae bacterium]|nr:tetratricopeptide repeat protein [Muribaculaceae bacterium]